MADQTTVTVSLTVDWPALRQLAQELRDAGGKDEHMLLRFLQDFRAQGEQWRREVQADPLLARVLRVEVEARGRRGDYEPTDETLPDWSEV